VNLSFQNREPRLVFLLLCLALALGTAALYWPITSHPFILYDDEAYVTNNKHVTTGLSVTNFIWAFTTGEAANWHPLTWLSHQTDCTLFGLQAGWHHFGNLLFHMVNTLLIFVFLRRATGAVWRSALVSALFAWHPLHVESVAWVSERKDMLSTFFWMLTLLAYLSYVECSLVKNFKAKPFYALTLFFFACGLMSKPMVVTLPCVLLLLDFWPLERISNAGPKARSFKFLLLEKIPFFVLAAAGSVVTLLVQSSGGAMWHTSLAGRFANAAVAYSRYVAKTFWPDDLAIIYAHPEHWPLVMSLGAALALTAWTVLCVRNWRQKPYLAVGWFWFLGTLVPTIGIIQVGGQYMADRYTYIPSIGLFIVLVWGAADLVSTRPQWKKISLVAAGGALVGCLVMTSIQISYWRDNVRLFRHAIEVTQDNYIAANCLGIAYDKIGDHVRALFFFKGSVEARARFPESQYNYGMALINLDQKAEGLKHLEIAANLTQHDPDVQCDLGDVFAFMGSWTNSVNCYQQALQARPNFHRAQAKLQKLRADHPELP
jgi:tetratricopeptide (TPR) repeat protein